MSIVVMGVSGSGKSTLGRALAVAIGADFQEGDELHPPANVAKMRAGMPLDDDDRAPWLERIAAWLASEHDLHREGVVTCSALKLRYRQRLRQAADGVRFLYLQVSPNDLQERLRRRKHFMPVGLLDSQLHTLEEPRNEPDVLLVAGTNDLAQIVADVRSWLVQPLPGVDPQAT